MKRYRDILFKGSEKSNCHQLSDDELHNLQKLLLSSYKEIETVCKKHNISISMTGGNAIGALRHNGFIPWDDDMDLMMSRKDYEIFKRIFKSELGDKYVLNAPNFSKKPTNRFPKILIRGTKFVEMEMDDDDRACIKMDLFILENIPQNKFYCLVKGLFCNFLMYIASVVETYERRYDSSMMNSLDGMKLLRKRVFIGRIFSFYSSYKWFNIVDKYCQYHKSSNLIGTPTGTYHYFGTIMDKRIIYPLKQVDYENNKVFIPNQCDKYLKILYGDYMKIPPVEKREHHFVKKISFGDYYVEQK